MIFIIDKEVIQRDVEEMFPDKDGKNMWTYKFILPNVHSILIKYVV